jgi:FtsH-binding integral membrane protein
MDFAISSISAVIVSLYSYKLAHPDWNTATCDHFARNAYLYALSMLVIFWMFLALYRYLKLEKYIVNVNIIGLLIFLIVALILLFVLIYIIKKTDPRRKILKHALLLIFTALFALFAYPAYITYQYFLLIALGISVLIGFLTYKFVMAYPNAITPEIAQIINYTLIAVIVINILVAIFVLPLLIINYPSSVYFVIMIFAVALVILFSMRMLIHHKNIMDHAKICDMSNHLPDYINEAIGVFITFVNLIMEIARILFIRKQSRLGRI